jgi:hypothetical protein
LKKRNPFRYLRNLTVLLVFSLAVLIPGHAVAAGNAVVSVSVPTGTINQGQQFTVSINTVPNNAIAGMQFNLTFNPAVVTVNSITEGNLFKQGGASTYFSAGNINNTAGTVTGVFGAITSPGQTVATAGTFATITMTAGSTGGSTSLTLSDVVVGDASSQPIPVSINNGTISVETSPGSTPPPGGGGGDGGGGDGGSGVGGGGGGSSDIINLYDLMTNDGQALEDIIAADSSSKVELHISQGTFVKNKYGQPAFTIIITPSEESQPADLGSVMIGQAYDIGPSGTTFEGEVTLVFNYSSSDIPADVPANNLYIVLWDPDTTTWIDLGGTIDAEAGTVSVPISHLSIYALMAHNRPANLVLTNLAITPNEVAPGETVTASIDISNQGDLTGTYPVSLMLDGIVIQNRNVSINGGASETVVFTIIAGAADEHQVSLGGLTGTFVVKEPSAAASFTVSGLTIEPTSVNAGEKANISVYIRNSGDLAGNYTLTLSVDDVTVETREVTLDGGGSMTVGFTFTTVIAGSHQVNINGLEDVLEVKPSSPVPVPEISGLELNSFSTTPIYDETTNTLVSVRIDYQMNQSWASLLGSRLVMMVTYTGQILEQVPLFTPGQVKEDGISGVLSYIPAKGWKAGEYTFQAKLYDGENVVQESQSHALIVVPEEITKAVSWWTLGAIIGIASVLMVALLGIVIYQRRDMLRY